MSRKTRQRRSYVVRNPDESDGRDGLTMPGAIGGLDAGPNQTNGLLSDEAWTQLQSRDREAAMAQFADGGPIMPVPIVRCYVPGEFGPDDDAATIATLVLSPAVNFRIRVALNVETYRQLREALGWAQVDAAAPYQEYLQSSHWQILRLYARRRAGDACQLCHSGGALHVHHRTYERRGNELPGDLIALCERCHGKFHDRLPEP